MNDLTRMFLTGITAMTCLGTKDTAVIFNTTYNITYNMMDENNLKSILEAFDMKDANHKKYKL